MAAPPPPTFGIPSFTPPPPPSILELLKPIQQVRTVEVIQEVPYPPQPVVDVDLFKVPENVRVDRGCVTKLDFWTIGGMAVGVVLVLTFIRKM